MKTTVTILLAVFAAFSHAVSGEKVVHESKVHPEHGLIYDNDTGKLFNGYAYRSYPDGKMRKKHHIKNGDYNGVTICYAHDGRITGRDNRRNGLVHGETIMYHKNGRIHVKQYYIDAVLNGKYIDYYSNGKVNWTANFKNGFTHGRRLCYYNDGTLKETGRIEYGFRVGECRSFHKNGRIHEKEFFDAGVKHGNYESYYWSGQLKEKGTFFLGQKNGVFHYYDTDGRLEKTESYLMGEKDGDFCCFDDNGNMQRIDKFKQGSCLESCYYTNDGQVVRRSNYEYKPVSKHKKIKLASFNGGFNCKKYDSMVIYPFLRKYIGRSKEFRDHILFDGLCKKISGTMNQANTEKYLYYAKKLTAKDSADPISTIFLYYTDRGCWNNDQWLKRIDKCLPKVDKDNFCYYQLRWMKGCIKKDPQTPQKLRKLAFDIAAGKLSKRESQYVYRLIKACTVEENIDLGPLIGSVNNENVWLKNMLKGMNCVLSIKKHPESGLLKDDCKSKVEEARDYLLQAWNMHKELPESSCLMIYLSMVDGSIDDCITWFYRCTLAQCDYQPAYDIMDKAMPPELLKRLGDACFNNACIMGNIRNNLAMKMLTYYQKSSVKYGNNLWQTPYREKGSLERIDKCLDRWLNRAGRKSRRYSAAKAIFLLYAGEYASAEAIIQKIGPKNFTRLEKRFKKQNGEYFRKGTNDSDRIKYYTGAHADKIIEAENCFYAGNAKDGMSKFNNLIKSPGTSGDTRNFIIKLRDSYSEKNSSKHNYH